GRLLRLFFRTANGLIAHILICFPLTPPTCDVDKRRYCVNTITLTNLPDAGRVRNRGRPLFFPSTVHVVPRPSCTSTRINICGSPIPLSRCAVDTIEFRISRHRSPLPNPLALWNGPTTRLPIAPLLSFLVTLAL